MRALVRPSPVSLPAPQSPEAQKLQPNRRQRRAISALFQRYNTRQRLNQRRRQNQRTQATANAVFGVHETLARAALVREMLGLNARSNALK